MAFAICILSVNFCSADPYENNPNYLYIGAGNGGMWYFKKSSLNVQEPHYQIAGKFVSYSGYYHKVGQSIYSVQRYNWYTKESFSLQNGRWVKNETGGTDNISRSNRRTADALFRAAYGMDFYGY